MSVIRVTVIHVTFVTPVSSVRWVISVRSDRFDQVPTCVSGGCPAPPEVAHALTEELKTLDGVSSRSWQYYCDVCAHHDLNDDYRGNDHHASSSHSTTCKHSWGLIVYDHYHHDNDNQDDDEDTSYDDDDDDNDDDNNDDDNDDDNNKNDNDDYNNDDDHNDDDDDDDDDDVQVSLPTGSVFSYRCLPGHHISGSSLIWSLVGWSFWSWWCPGYWGDFENDIDVSINGRKL